LRKRTWKIDAGMITENVRAMFRVGYFESVPEKRRMEEERIGLRNVFSRANAFCTLSLDKALRVISLKTNHTKGGEVT
jgi:hypothetical protein